MYKSPIGEQVDEEIIAARWRLAAVGALHPDREWTSYGICDSARQNASFNISALGLAIESMIEDGSCVRDPETGFVTFPLD